MEISAPIRSSMYIGSKNKGVSRIDFRYEKLPMFCFYCGFMNIYIIDSNQNMIDFYIVNSNSNPQNTVWRGTIIYGNPKSNKKFSHVI